MTSSTCSRMHSCTKRAQLRYPTSTPAHSVTRAWTWICQCRHSHSFRLVHSCGTETFNSRTLQHSVLVFRSCDNHPETEKATVTERAWIMDELLLVELDWPVIIASSFALSSLSGSHERVNVHGIIVSHFLFELAHL